MAAVTNIGRTINTFGRRNGWRGMILRLTRAISPPPPCFSRRHRRARSARAPNNHPPTFCSIRACTRYSTGGGRKVYSGQLLPPDRFSAVDLSKAWWSVWYAWYGPPCYDQKRQFMDYIVMYYEILNSFDIYFSLFLMGSYIQYMFITSVANTS